jgi:16S rRNA G966 N2-methylase RsmD
VDQAPAALGLLRRNLAGTQVQVLPRDAMRLEAGAFRGLGTVFADPPYAESGRLLADLAPRILGWLDADGWLVWECPAKAELPLPAGFRLLDRRVYGAAAFHFLGCSSMV